MRGREEETVCPGYLTVYLALTMAVLLPLCLALIEGARSNAIRMETECVTEIGMDSILAEYHRKLLEEYNLFAIDSSYGTDVAGYEKVKEHLQRYLERNLSREDIFLADYLYRDFLAVSVSSIEMKGVSILTDEKGAVFRRRAAEVSRDDYNLTLLKNLDQWVRTVESKGLMDYDIASQKHVVDEEIRSFDGQEIQISESEWTTVEVENPTEELEEIRKKGILGMVVEDEEALSSKLLHPENLVMARMERGEINKGNLSLSQETEAEQLKDRFLFQEYLLKYMGHYGTEKENSALAYQIEYLLAGKNGDTENLKSVVNTICAIREAANAIYLFSDEEKCMEAEVVATVVATLLQVPELAKPLKVSLLLGWAFAESVHDVKLLMAGGKVPLLKDAETWHYRLENALHIGKEAEVSDEMKGLSYEDYLRLLMVFENVDMLTGRAMNMVEADIRSTPGNAAFRLDACYDEVIFRICVSSKYGYEYEIIRGKRY